MSDHSVLVIGPSGQTTRVVSALKAAGLAAWSDDIDRALLDPSSFEWADALVVIDLTKRIETQHLGPLTEFYGPSLLATPSAIDGEPLSRLIDCGFDAVVQWPSSVEVIVARVRRMLGVTPVRIDAREQREERIAS